jgi:uncharacterized protein (DUF433 family)
VSHAETIYAYKTPEGGWRVADSRVSLDSVVCAFLEGKSADEIAEEFPSLSLVQIHAALEFYLRNQQEIDEYLFQQDEKWKDLAAQSELRHGPLLRRLRKRRPNSADE